MTPPDMKAALCLVAIVILPSIANLAMAHHCYVCGGSEDLSCDHFDPSNSNYMRECLKECPKSSKGCSTQTHGSTITRSCSCENHQLDDCQTANGVRYCYCSKNLCNGNLNDATGGRDNFTDDEDLLDDGSGSSAVNRPPGRDRSPSSSNNNVSSVATLSFVNLQSYLFSKIYLMVFLLFCN